MREAKNNSIVLPNPKPGNFSLSAYLSTDNVKSSLKSVDLVLFVVLVAIFWQIFVLATTGRLRGTSLSANAILVNQFPTQPSSDTQRN